MFKLRPYEEGDHNAILNYWLKSLSRSPFAMSMPKDVFFFEHQRVIKKALEYCKKDILVACDVEEPTHLYGPNVGKAHSSEGLLSVDIIHFYFVKKIFRNLGIASALTKAFLKHENKDVVITFKGKDALLKGHAVQYNPYLLLNTAYMENHNGN